ncbi:MAG: hypothetical protein ACD_60C00166G0007 [uncultured bacterium]|nr:MAG: hypothetical protein ACD_60C00166G0007 [uncultured bacterium]
MPQKKVKRTKKKMSAKHTSKASILTLAEKVEQEFRALPTRLAKLYRQELMNLKSQETKLKTEFKKAQIMQKAAEKKQAALVNSKKTTGLVSAKKAYQKATKLFSETEKELAQLNKIRVTLTAKQLKYTTLNKQLAVIEKQLAKKTSHPVNKIRKNLNKVRKNKSVPVQQIETAARSQDIPATVSSPTETVEIN